MNSRSKGARGERQLAKKLKEYGYNTRRGQQYSGANGDADVVGIEGLHIECKCYKSGHGKTYEWLDQSAKDARENETAVVMHRKVSTEDRGNPWLVTLSLDDFMKLWKLGMK